MYRYYIEFDEGDGPENEYGIVDEAGMGPAALKVAEFYGEKLNTHVSTLELYELDNVIMDSELQTMIEKKDT